MNTKEPTFLKLVFSLFIISAVAGVALAGVHIITKDKIAKQADEKKQEAIAIVLPDYKGEFKIEKKLLEGDKDPVTIYSAYEGEKLKACAIETYTEKGFGGHVDVFVGFDADGNITGTEVLKHSETPGLGDKMSKKVSPWANQFNGKNPKDFKLKVKKDGGDVDAITAATISSRAYCDALNRAYQIYLKVKEGK